MGTSAIEAEVQTAKNWYRWLWRSPFFTIPSAFLIGVLLESVPIAIFGSALWHLVLLVPAFNRESEFVRWHGRQALLLAGIRTAVALVSVSLDAPCLILVLIAVWLFGTHWGQQQAARGDCSLMRRFGRAEALPAYLRAETQTSTRELDPETLVNLIRYSPDPEERRQALAELEKLGLVESL